MEIKPPDCCAYTWAPCTEADWRQCGRCGSWVCGIHGDGLYPIRHSGTGRRMAMMCWDCL